MADRNNEEYEFADLDNMGSDLLGEEPGSQINDGSGLPSSSKKNVPRNALIVIVLVVIGLLVYKFMGAFFHKQPADNSQIVSVSNPNPVVTPEVPIQTLPEQVPVVETPVSTPSQPDASTTQKLNAMDINQQNMRTDINNLTSQLGGINASISNLNTKVTSLSSSINMLAEKLEQQNQQIALLIAAKKAKPKPVAIKRPTTPAAVYYIQAVIPGRAWLISTKGSTLTVREGSIIAGYGRIIMIDSVQGRVLTSSGRVIRFNQQDT